MYFICYILGKVVKYGEAGKHNGKGGGGVVLPLQKEGMVEISFEVILGW